ncbi:MAG: ATP-binding protein [Candidatus Thermoplasmatota archaeon]|nr:ATP-binding protein [Candidatus Thermoplasmatota archaeon]
MSRAEDFRIVISEWFLQDIPEVFERDLSIPLNIKPIVSIVDPRRAGKTFVMYSLIRKLREKIGPKNVLYVNFEHERLRNLDANDLSDIISVYYELSNPDQGSEIYLFLDEIQVVNDWSKWINRIYENKKFHIYISGSSSKLLSRELSTELRDRSIDFTLLPYSFSEYLRFHSVNFSNLEMMLHSEKRGIIAGALREYLSSGGFPEVVSMSNGQSRLLMSYADTIIIKDVGERFRIEPSVLSVFFNYAIATYSKYFTGSKTYNFLKSLNYRISRGFPLELMDHFQEAFALFEVEIFSPSVKSCRQYPCKLYVVDTGIINVSIRNGEVGRLIENIVFLELYRRYNQSGKFLIRYWKEYGKTDGKEVDFVILDGNKVTELINVAYASSREDVPDQEILGMIKASEELKCKKMSIITWDYFQKGDIEFIPLWYWLLDGTYALGGLES